MKYLGIRTAKEIMNRETIKDFAVSPKAKYHVFSNNDNTHTVGVPLATSMNFTEIENHARESMPIN